MGKLGHWTNRSAKDFQYRIAADFVAQIESAMEDSGITQSQLAKILGVTEGRVSQVLNNPGNLTLGSVVQYCRALGRKVTLAAYDDGDAENENGPVNSQVFERCWERMGKPLDLFDLEAPPLAETGSNLHNLIPNALNQYLDQPEVGQNIILHMILRVSDEAIEDWAYTPHFRMAQPIGGAEVSAGFTGPRTEEVLNYAGT